MLEDFKSLIHSRDLLNPNGNYLLACSGGLDSMCLGHLLIQAEFSFEVAHVNFQLRGLESKGDQSFVENWAKSHNIPFHLKLAETETFAKQRGISIQMAAREIRYSFFDEIRTARHLDGIILAHQEDDQLETIFLNLLRGTGIEGIYGMADRKGYLIRPLLSFSRSDLQDFMEKNHLTWREDSSNEKSDYKRNNLRINGLTAIYALEKDAKKNLLTSFLRLKETGRAFSGLFETWKKTNIREEESFQYLSFSAIHNQPGVSTLLYFWLRPYGFNSDQAQTIAEALDQPKTGLVFQSQQYQLHFDRQELILSLIQEDFEPILVTEDAQELFFHNENYKISQQDIPIQLDKNPNNAQLDFSRLEFPLEIRGWSEGDKFIPLGMNSSKKISDFLIDLKIPLAKKQAVKVLLSGGEIAWVIGLRIADWAKCTASTQRVLYFKKY